jgi:hypothetical protein
MFTDNTIIAAMGTEAKRRRSMIGYRLAIRGVLYCSLFSIVLYKEGYAGLYAAIGLCAVLVYAFALPEAISVCVSVEQLGCRPK